jgi:hypothetical protein
VAKYNADQPTIGFLQTVIGISKRFRKETAISRVSGKLRNPSSHTKQSEQCKPIASQHIHEEGLVSVQATLGSQQWITLEESNEQSSTM